MSREKRRFIFTVATIIVVIIITIILGALAHGYRFDFKGKKLHTTGLLAATSIPDGASVWIDGKLKTATDQTISLPPGEYEIEIKKPGYSTWKKKITIYKELVASTEAYLFPLAPDLKALTFTSALKPQTSPDGSKVVYLTQREIVSSSPSPSPSPAATPSSSPKQQQTVIKVLELGEKPFGNLNKPKLLAKIPPLSPEAVTFTWSPDSRQILLNFTTNNQENKLLLEINKTYDFTQLPLLSLTKKEEEDIITAWQKEKEKEEKSQEEKIPIPLEKILKENCQKISLSPDETKILYQAQKEVSLPEKIITKEIIAPSSQKETRHLTPGNWYIFDIKEDKNFLVLSSQEENTPKIRWFPTSAHLILIYPQEKIDIIEYDGTNQTTVYKGPFEDYFAYPFPSGKKLLILTSLGGKTESTSHFYAVSLQ